MAKIEKPDLEQLKHLVAEGLASGTSPWAGIEATLAEVRKRAKNIKAMGGKKVSKAFPRLESDEAAEALVDTADLSVYDLSDMSPTGFEFAAKVVRVDMHPPAELPEDVEATNSRRDMPGKNGRP
ncbi:MAG TPA: CopG family antitoxin [Allosphingosinicella sp.]|nr:CopG family antitoxin [Allosphingosinicella sp.]